MYKDIPIFSLDDLPEYHHSESVYQNKFGFSIYKNVLIQWDEDYDKRILNFIDQMPEKYRNNLLFCHEHEANLLLFWCKEVPVKYREDEEIEVKMYFEDSGLTEKQCEEMEIDKNNIFDIWNILYSVGLKKKDHRGESPTATQ